MIALETFRLLKSTGSEILKDNARGKAESELYKQ
jgi:hypothetical protein